MAPQASFETAPSRGCLGMRFSLNGNALISCRDGAKRRLEASPHRARDFFRSLLAQRSAATHAPGSPGGIIQLGQLRRHAAFATHHLPSHGRTPRSSDLNNRRVGRRSQPEKAPMRSVFWRASSLPGHCRTLTGHQWVKPGDDEGGRERIAFKRFVLSRTLDPPFSPSSRSASRAPRSFVAPANQPNCNQREKMRFYSRKGARAKMADIRV